VRLDRYQTLAAGDVASQLDLSKIEKLVVDGVEIRDFSALSASYDKLANRDRGALAKLIDGRAKWLADKTETPKDSDPEITAAADQMKPFYEARSTVRSLKEKFFGTRIGKWIQTFMKANHEAVATSKNVEIRLKNGHSVTVPTDAEDLKRSLILQRIQLGLLMIEAVPGVPFVGLVLPPTAAAVSLLSAGIARAAGDAPLSKALTGMAFRQGMMFTGNALPMVGAAIPAMAAAGVATHIRAATS
jgi:hypothetical protein